MKMKTFLRRRVSTLWLAAIPPLVLLALRPLCESSLVGLSGNALSAREAFGLAVYLGMYVCAVVVSPTVLLSWCLQRLAHRVIVRHAATGGKR